jgi:hypothetical protein
LGGLQAEKISAQRRKGAKIAKQGKEDGEWSGEGDPILSVDRGVRGAHFDWRSGIFSFCSGLLGVRGRKSLRGKWFQIVDLCAKSIAIDKMDSFCRSASRRRALFAG